VRSPSGVPLRPGGSQIIPRPTGWSPGEQPPWPEPTRQLSTGELISIVRAADVPVRHDAFPHEVRIPDGMRPAAVLVVLADGPRGAEVLLTRRSMEMRTHRGEVSFPGGRLDPGEHFAMAALREAHEEVGLDPHDVEVIGALPPLGLMASTSWIMPVVARAPERFDLEACTPEVDRVLWVPIAELTAPGTYREEYWQLPAGEFSIVFFHLDDETVWGATARVLRFMLRAAHGLPLLDSTTPYREAIAPTE
jgi:8-oxo-dGTP pyrophosphatase MutT (NUDIX family)